MPTAERMAESIDNRLRASAMPARSGILLPYTSALLLAREALAFCAHGCEGRCPHTVRTSIVLAVINALVTADA